MLDIVQLSSPIVQEKLREIRLLIENGEAKEAEDKVWELYQSGYIVDYELYQDYKRKI